MSPGLRRLKSIEKHGVLLRPSWLRSDGERRPRPRRGSAARSVHRTPCVERAAARLAKARVSGQSRRCTRRAWRQAAAKQSPAPVVSTTSAGRPRASSNGPSIDPRSRAPASPSDVTTVEATNAVSWPFEPLNRERPAPRHCRTACQSLRSPPQARPDRAGNRRARHRATLSRLLVRAARDDAAAERRIADGCQVDVGHTPANLLVSSPRRLGR